jgi:hypothetical protein
MHGDVRGARIRDALLAACHRGETVTVEVHDYPPGVVLNATLCAAPDPTGSPNDEA